MHSYGYNPLLWKCNESGCFNELRRPKIEVFYDCFPGKINFGDVDGMVEIKGYFCFLEWKGQYGSIRMAQEIAYRQLTKTKGNAVFVVDGNAKTMETKRYMLFWDGKNGNWKYASIDEVKKRIKSWADWASKQVHRIGSVRKETQNA